MDKPHDSDDTTLLATRFHTLMDKVQGLIDELHAPPRRADGAVPTPSEQGRKAYTIHAAAGFDERRKQALIEVIDEALRQIDSLEAADVGPLPCAESKRRAAMVHGEKIFSLEELHFLEHTLRTFRAFPAE